MFKKDDYIVCLNTPENDIYYPKNHIFKQRENAKYLCSSIDNSGSFTSGWGSIKFDGSKQYSNWRYATQEEIDEYERLGKPYDVTTLKEFVLPEKWCIKGSVCKTVQQFFLTYKDNLISDFVSHDSYIKYWFFSEKNKMGFYSYYEKDEDFTEITLDQFKEYVLKQKVEQIPENYDYLIDIFTKFGIK